MEFSYHAKTCEALKAEVKGCDNPICNRVGHLLVGGALMLIGLMKMSMAQDFWTVSANVTSSWLVGLVVGLGVVEFALGGALLWRYFRRGSRPEGSVKVRSLPPDERTDPDKGHRAGPWRWHAGYR